MAEIGALNRYNISITNQVIGTAGTKTYLGQSSYQILRSLRDKTIQVYNVGFSNTGAGTVGSLVAGVVEVSNDNVHWGTLTSIAGGTLNTETSYFWAGTNAWGWYRFGVAFPADNIGTISAYMVF
jgi:hypothetical protein